MLYRRLGYKMLILLILILFLVVPAFSFVLKKPGSAGKLNILVQTIVSVLVLRLCFLVAGSGTPLSAYNIFYIDALGAYFMLVISVTGLASAVYSLDYIKEEVKEGKITVRRESLYYLLFNLFLLSMYLVVTLNSLWVMWIAVELTTMVSAFLVGFYNKKTSVEAAWKYLIICSVGITLALFGTLLFYYTASVHGLVKESGWTALYAGVSKFDPMILKVAFLFIIAGYGTKAGLAPMHNWLPDAHSQSPSPISALLSGVLLKTSLYAVIRFAIIVNKNSGPGFTGNLFLLFGIISLIIAAFFIITQRDIKRLLAYSSVEHVGIIAAGLGTGTALGIFGSLFHVFNHAVTKSLMFFGAGNITKKYGTNSMMRITGVLKTLPFTGVIIFAGVFALAGTPPFSIFMSEIAVIVGAFKGPGAMVGILILLPVVVIFAGLVFHFTKMLLGSLPEGMKAAKEPVSVKIVFLSLLAIIVIFGLRLPWILRELINQAVVIIRGS